MATLKKAPFEIVNSLILTKIKVIYGKGEDLPGTLDSYYHGMIYVIAGYFKTDAGKILVGYPNSKGEVEFSDKKISGTYTIYGKD